MAKTKKTKRSKKQSSPPGNIAQKLRLRFITAKKQKVIPLAELREIRKNVHESVKTLKRPEEIAESGSDPVFALYASVQQLISFVAEGLLSFPELRKFSSILEQAEEEYMPSFPPMSPITMSHFAMWSLCDAKIGASEETLANIFVQLGHDLGLEDDYIEVARKLSQSRMGIYEYLEKEENTVLLRELVTDKEIPCVCNSGYEGENGELWFVRLAPPPVDFIPYSITMVTPYVLRAPKKEEWVKFFDRNGICKTNLGYETQLERFFK